MFRSKDLVLLELPRPQTSNQSISVNIKVFSQRGRISRTSLASRNSLYNHRNVPYQLHLAPKETTHDAALSVYRHPLRGIPPLRATPDSGR